MVYWADLHTLQYFLAAVDDLLEGRLPLLGFDRVMMTLERAN